MGRNPEGDEKVSKLRALKIWGGFISATLLAIFSFFVFIGGCFVEENLVLLGYYSVLIGLMGIIGFAIAMHLVNKTTNFWFDTE